LLRSRSSREGRGGGEEGVIGDMLNAHQHSERKKGKKGLSRLRYSSTPPRGKKKVFSSSAIESEEEKKGGGDAGRFLSEEKREMKLYISFSRRGKEGGGQPLLSAFLNVRRGREKMKFLRRLEKGVLKHVCQKVTISAAKQGKKALRAVGMHQASPDMRHREGEKKKNDKHGKEREVCHFSFFARKGRTNRPISLERRGERGSHAKLRLFERGRKTKRGKERDERKERQNAYRIVATNLGRRGKDAK